MSPSEQQTFAVESARLPTLRSLYEDDEVLENTRPRPVSPAYSDMPLVMAE